MVLILDRSHFSRRARARQSRIDLLAAARPPGRRVSAQRASMQFALNARTHPDRIVYGRATNCEHSERARTSRAVQRCRFIGKCQLCHAARNLLRNCPVRRVRTRRAVQGIHCERIHCRRIPHIGGCHH